jgi:hypothetical protein
MKNAAVPFNFWGRAKNSSVFWGPIIIVRPIRKRIYMQVRTCGMEDGPPLRKVRKEVVHCP